MTPERTPVGKISYGVLSALGAILGGVGTAIGGFFVAAIAGFAAIGLCLLVFWVGLQLLAQVF